MNFHISAKLIKLDWVWKTGNIRTWGHIHIWKTRISIEGKVLLFVYINFGPEKGRFLQFSSNNIVRYCIRLTTETVEGASLAF